MTHLKIGKTLLECCPHCGSAFVDKLQTICFECSYFLVAQTVSNELNQIDEVAQKAWDKRSFFVKTKGVILGPMDKESYAKNPKSFKHWEAKRAIKGSIIQALQARQRNLQMKQKNTALSSHLEMELGFLSEQITTVERLSESLVGSLLRAVVDKKPEGLEEEVEKAEKKEPPEPTEAEKKKQQFEVALGKHEAPKRVIAKKIKELQAEKFKLEKALKQFKQIEDPPDQVEISIKQCETELERVNNDIIAYKQKLKSMSG